MLKRFLFSSLLGMAVLPAFAGQPDFDFVKALVIPSTPPNFYPRMTAATADSTGGVYFVENVNDYIHYMADPLTASVGTDTILVGSGDSFAFSSGSWMGITIDSNNTVFASGSGTNRSGLMRIINSGGNVTTTSISLPSTFSSGAGFTRLGGCSAVGPNKLVIPGYTDGKLYFFTVAGNSATLDATVNAPAGYAGVSSCALFANGKIYMSNAVSSTSNGGIYAWTSDGTPTNTKNPVQLVAPISGQSSSNSLYCSLSYNATFNVLAINEGHNAADKQGWAMYDVSQTAAPWTSYKFLNGSEAGAPGSLAPGDAAMGHVFFKKGSDEYFMTSNEDATPIARQFWIYKLKPGAAVSDWSVY